jgi:hypothetical protein
MSSNFDFEVICSFLLGVCRPYVSEQAGSKLKLYKYKGGDSGFVYKFLYNPLALNIVEKYVPETLA